MSTNIKNWNAFIGTKTAQEKTLIKEAIELFTKAKFDVWHEYCAVCAKSISEEDRKGINSTDYNITCTDHRKYSQAYNLDKALKEDGIMKKDANDLISF